MKLSEAKIQKQTYFAVPSFISNCSGAVTSVISNFIFAASTIKTWETHTFINI